MAIKNKNIKFFASYGTSAQLPKSIKPEISFVGRSNVGKSSLLNKLCGQNKLAKVSSKPGKTTTINFFNTGDFFLVDLPGYGFAARSKSELTRWSNLIEGYFLDDRNFALVVSLIDIRHDPTKLDIDMLNYLHEMGLPFMVTLTKSDKLSKQQLNNAKRKIYNYIDERIPVIATSAISSQGINELEQKILLAIN